MTAFKVTEEMIDQYIEGAEVVYDVLSDKTTTICSIILFDGRFSVRGQSSCVDPNSFNEHLGRKYSYEDAYEKMWGTLGVIVAYELWMNETIRGQEV